MSARVLLAALLFALMIVGNAPALAQTAPPGYSLDCAPKGKAIGGHVLLDCTLRATHPGAAANAFGSWRYGDPIPKAILAQVVGMGGPAVCTGINIICSNGVIALNTGGTLGASATLCTNSSALITTTGCAAGGGDTITSPGSSLTVGGTSAATTLDVALGHTNNYTVFQCFAGTGGANACAGANFPGGVFGIVAGANNGANQGGVIIGPGSTDFNCSASCTAGDSERIRFFSSLSTGAVNGCDEYINTALSQKPIYFSCPLSAGGAVSGKATNAATTYLPPIYSTSGGAVANTLHGILFTCAFAAATTCAVTITGTGNSFVSATSYSCFVDMGSSTTNIQFTVGNKTTSGFTVYAGTSNSDTVAGLCVGT